MNKPVKERIGKEGVIFSVIKVTSNIFVECDDCGWDGTTLECKEFKTARGVELCCPECKSNQINSVK